MKNLMEQMGHFSHIHTHIVTEVICIKSVTSGQSQPASPECVKYLMPGPLQKCRHTQYSSTIFFLLPHYSLSEPGVNDDIKQHHEQIHSLIT